MIYQTPALRAYIIQSRDPSRSVFLSRIEMDLPGTSLTVTASLDEAATDGILTTRVSYGSFLVLARSTSIRYVDWTICHLNQTMGTGSCDISYLPAMITPSLLMSA